MSKADPTGESLESILASIRRSLAEQSTDILNEDAGTAPEAGYEPQPMMPGEDDDMPRLFGGAGAGAADAAPRNALSGPVLEDPPPPAPAGAAPPHLSPPGHAEMHAPVETPARPAEEPPPPAGVSFAAAPAPAQGPKDALWFLGRGDAAAERNGVQVPQPPTPAQTAAEAKPIRTEIVRGPLPPFFGSSAEAAKVEVAPVPDISIPSVMPPFPPPPAARGLAGDPLPGPVTNPATNPTPGAATATHSLPGLRAGAVARDDLPNGKAASFLGQPATDGRATATDGRGAAAGGPAQSQGLQGLEAMVAELLRPMLRRWLDENMPRLVSAALKAEAELMARRDPKKP
jgi:cell pole-organizing protein PopZ